MTKDVIKTVQKKVYIKNIRSGHEFCTLLRRHALNHYVPRKSRISRLATYGREYSIMLHDNMDGDKESCR